MRASARLLLAVLFAARASSTDWSFVREPEFLFTFGDSYTSENWDWPHAPLSSPLDAHQIATWCNGPVWARQFADTHTQQRTQLVNYAVAGATLDNGVVHNDWAGGVLDVQGQLAAFLAHQHQHPHSINKSVFAFAFGANDIWFSLNSTDARYSALADGMVSALGRLRAGGARAFAWTTALPFDRARLAADAGPGVQARLAERITTFNARMQRAMSEWCAAQGSDVFCVIIDTYSLASRIIARPGAYGFKEAHDFCWAYTARFAGLEGDDYSDPSCVGPVSEYLWRDQIHPSYAFHALWAQLFRDTLDERLAAYDDGGLRVQRPARIRLRE